jgi:hypothetical protein
LIGNIVVYHSKVLVLRANRGILDRVVRGVVGDPAAASSNQAKGYVSIELGKRRM